MISYALHPEAYIDIDEIGEHIAEDSPEAADRVVTEIFDSIRALIPSPSGLSPPQYYIPPANYN